MDRPASAATLRIEPYGSDGPRWVVGRAEAELIARYGGLDDGELGLTAAMFDPPTGSFLVARAGGEHPVGGAGVRTVAEGVGEVRRLWVDPAWRGQGVGRVLMIGLEDAALALGPRALHGRSPAGGGGALRVERVGAPAGRPGGQAAAGVAPPLLQGHR